MISVIHAFAFTSLGIRNSPTPQTTGCRNYDLGFEHHFWAEFGLVVSIDTAFARLSLENDQCQAADSRRDHVPRATRGRGLWGLFRLQP